MQQTLSDGYKVFLGLVLGIVLANLLLMNAYTSVLPRGELSTLMAAFQGDYSLTHFLPEFILARFQSTTELPLFTLRLLSVSVTIGGVWLFYFLGKKVFGQPSMIAFILVTVSSLLIVNLGKFALVDPFLGVAHLASFIFLILSLKKPIAQWQISFGLSFLVAFLIEPISSLIFCGGMYFYLMLLHPKGSNLRPRAIFWLLPLGLIAAMYFMGELDLNRATTTWLGTSFGDWGFYLKMIFLGMLPWLGFVPAGFWDLFQKIKKREELSIILIGWLLFGLLSQSLVAEYALCFIVGKQVLGFTQKNYPHQNKVKAMALLNLVAIFCLVTVFILNGYYRYEGTGLRSAVSIGAVGWAFGLLGVIGLFMNSRRMIHAAFVLCGVMMTFLFWYRVNPIIESYRSTPRQIMEKAHDLTEGNANTPIYLMADTEENRLPQYRLLAMSSPFIQKVEIGFLDFLTTNQSPAIIIMDKIHWDNFSKKASVTPTEMTTRTSFLGEEEPIWIFRQH